MLRTNFHQWRVVNLFITSFIFLYTKIIQYFLLLPPLYSFFHFKGWKVKYCNDECMSEHGFGCGCKRACLCVLKIAGGAARISSVYFTVLFIYFYIYYSFSHLSTQRMAFADVVNMNTAHEQSTLIMELVWSVNCPSICTTESAD